MAIKINKIVPQTVEAFDPDGKSLGFINEYEHLDLRCQIKEAKLDGYYLMYEDEKIDIDNEGKIHTWRKGLFDKFDDLLDRILGF